MRMLNICRSSGVRSATSCPGSFIFPTSLKDLFVYSATGEKQFFFSLPRILAAKNLFFQSFGIIKLWHDKQHFMEKEDCFENKDSERVGLNKVTIKEQKNLISFLMHNVNERKSLISKWPHHLSTYYAFFHNINQFAKRSRNAIARHSKEQFERWWLESINRWVHMNIICSYEAIL